MSLYESMPPPDADREVLVTCPTCPECGKAATVRMKRRQYEALASGSGHIQHILPDWDPAQRELLITGIHSACWDKLFAEDEED